MKAYTNKNYQSKQVIARPNPERKEKRLQKRADYDRSLKARGLIGVNTSIIELLKKMQEKQNNG